MSYDLKIMKDYADNGADLVSAIAHVASNGITSLDEALGLIIGCIASGYRTREAILEVWVGAHSIYDDATCEWLLNKFEGDDETSDLWRRKPDGRYVLLNSALERRSPG